MVLWLRFLKEAGEDMATLPPEMQENEFISQAAQLCERGTFTPEELDAYDKYWDIIRTERAIREGARREGRADGLVEGEAIGLEKGKAERTQLKAELKEKTENEASLLARIAELEQLMSGK